MASATQRFFAIPELLEQTLLSLSPDLVPIAPASTAMELFTLQLVNGTFASTIRGSKRLQWKMGLESYLPKAKRSPALPMLHIGALRIAHREFRIAPFKFCAQTSMGYTRLSTNPKALWLVFRVEADVFAEEYQGTLGFRAGLQARASRDSMVHRNQNQSWRRMRLTARGGQVAVVVFVSCPRDRMRADTVSGSFFEERVRFRSGEGTLGDLADFFEQIGRKKRIEHELGTVRYKGEYWMDVRPKEKKGVDWWRIAVELGGCACLAMLFIAGQWVWASMKDHPLVLSVLLWLLGTFGMVQSAYALLDTGWSRKAMEDKRGVRTFPIFN